MLFCPPSAAWGLLRPVLAGTLHHTVLKPGDGSHKDPSMREVEAGAPGAQGHPKLRREFKASLIYKPDLSCLEQADKQLPS